MDVGALRIFVDVARRGGFSPVAREAGVDPSSVSRTIAALEAELGIRLFQRSTRKLALTEAGASYLERVIPGLDALEAARDEVAGARRGPTGILRLAASVAFGQACLVPLLAEFRERFPELKLDLVLSDLNADLIAERIDLAVRLAPSIDLDLFGLKLMETRYRVCASPGYLATKGPIEKPADLVSHRSLRFPLPGYRDAWKFRKAETQEEVRIDGDIMASNALVLRSCSIAGLGPALLPDWLVQTDLEAGTLVDCLPEHDAAGTTFETGAWLLYPSRVHLPTKTRITVDYLKEKLGGHPSART